jgi:hypothetical protein
MILQYTKMNGNLILVLSGYVTLMKSAGNDNELIFLVLNKGHLSLYFMVLQEEK